MNQKKAQQKVIGLSKYALIITLWYVQIWRINENYYVQHFGQKAFPFFGHTQ